MAFAIVVLDKSPAARVMQSLQPPLRIAFWNKMREFNPVEHSRKSRVVPGQIYQFRVDISGLSTYFTIIFRFADTSDENTLWVAEIIANTV